MIVIVVLAQLFPCLLSGVKEDLLLQEKQRETPTLLSFSAVAWLHMDTGMLKEWEKQPRNTQTTAQGQTDDLRILEAAAWAASVLQRCFE